MDFSIGPIIYKSYNRWLMHLKGVLISTNNIQLFD